MSKKNGRFTVEIVSELQSLVSKQPRATTIIEEDTTCYPYCALPENFFDFALARDSLNKETKLLSIDSWDGREILNVVRKH